MAAVCFTASAPLFSVEEHLLVMLQGESSFSIKRLVEANGGKVTHDLGIINSVGAELTQSQLDLVSTSPLIHRVIDDLAVSGDQPEDSNRECNVGGSLELDFDNTHLRWPIYNKTENTEMLEKLNLNWPARLGPAISISIGDSIVDASQYADKHGKLITLVFSQEDAPILKNRLDLRISFRPPPEPHITTKATQKDFTLEAFFGEDCSTKLVPGYEDNHQDFYYARVAGADSLHAHGITGRGVTVAILDSGLWEQRYLANDTGGNRRVIARYNAITNVAGQELLDGSGHGSHMASIMAHSGEVIRSDEPTGTFKGIAPDVSLVIVKALDDQGQGDFLDLVRGVQWVVENREKYGIDILNLSIAARPRWPYWLDPLNQAVMRAWASGIVVVAAAGNEGPDPMTIGSPGNLPYVITVGAMTDSWTVDTRDDDYIPDFSSRGPTPSAHIKPDIVAPGGHMTGVTRPGSTLTLEHPDYLLSTGEFVMTGSSQAAALVSGLIALLLQLDPELSPDDIKCKLLSSAEPAINRDGLLAYSPFQQGHGLVSIKRAITLGQTGCGNADLILRHDLEGKKHFRGPAIIDETGNTTLPGLSTMLSPIPTEKGMSKSRKWGVKDHIERGDLPNSEPNTAKSSPFDWMEVYLREKATIEKLQNQPLN